MRRSKWIISIGLILSLILVACGTQSAKNRYSFSLEVSNGGTVSGTQSGTYDENYEIDLTATPNTLYSFSGWYINNELVSSQPQFKRQLTQNLQLSARFTAQPQASFTFNVSSQSGGTISGTRNGTYALDTSIRVTASANSGYRFIGWFSENTNLSTELSYSFLLKANLSLEARFELVPTQTFTLDVSSNAGGSISGTEPGSYDANTRITLVAIPETGYRFIGWYDLNTRLSVLTSYNFNITENRSIEARFELIPTQTFTYSIGTTTGGVITGSTQGGTYNAGTSILAVATANTGYRFIGWYSGQQLISSLVRYNFNLSSNITLQARFEVIPAGRFSYYAQSTDGGVITGTPNGSYDANTSVTATVSPSTGYTFNGWYNGETQVSTSLTYTFNLTANTSLEARFDINQYNYAVTTQTGGTLSGTQAGTYDYNTSINAVVTHTAEYRFLGWYNGSTQVSTNLSYTFNLTANTTIEARFERITYTYQVSTQTGGTLSGTQGGTYNSQSPITATVAVTSGYRFLGWYSGTQQVSTDLTYSFQLNQNTTIQARFEVIPVGNFAYNVSAQVGGTLSGNLSGNYAQNTSLTTTAQASAHYEFLGWFDGETELSKSLSYTFTITANRTIVARFKLVNYTFTKQAGSNGTVSGQENGTYEANTSINVVATANTGYRFIGWYNGTTQVSSESNYTFELKSNTSIEARFEIIKYTFSRSALTGGSVSGSANNSYDINTSLTVTAAANTGYRFLGWYNGSNQLSTSTTYTFNLTQNLTLTARFQKLTYAFSRAALSNGSVSGTANGTYEHDTSISLTATANQGYTFIGWYNGPTRVSTSASYTFLLTAATSLEARFEINSNVSYSFNVGTQDGGRLTGDTPQAYPANRQMSVTIEVLSGYRFLGWFNTANNTSLSTDLNYQFTLTQNTSIEARFEAIPLSEVTYSRPSVTGGTLEGTPDGTYTQGTSILAIARANASYTFDGWFVNNQLVSSQTEYTFTINANTVLEARFSTNAAVFTYTVTVQANGTLTGNQTGSYLSGQQVRTQAVANEGYVFDGWYENGQLLNRIETFVANIDKNITIEARFTPQAEMNYNLVRSSSNGGTVTGTANGSYLYDTQISLTASPSNDFTFDGWYLDGQRISTELVLSFQIRRDVNVEARFLPVEGSQYSYEVTATLGGTITGTENGFYQPNTTITATATTNSGYKFTGWFIGISLQSSSLTYTFQINENTSLRAVFESE